MNNILFTTTNWELVPKDEYIGLTGTSFWQTIQMGSLRMRIVTYSKNYIADH